MPTSFPEQKTATKRNLEKQPPYAAVSVQTKPQHMVVFSSLEIVLLYNGVLIVYFILLDAAGQHY